MSIVEQPYDQDEYGMTKRLMLQVWHISGALTVCTHLVT